MGYRSEVALALVEDAAILLKELCEHNTDLKEFIDGADEQRAWTLDEMLHRTYTDAFLVLYRGRVVEERYFNGMGRSTRHGMFSMTKTFTGILALLAVEDGWGASRR